jgi:hypothetical protein
MAPAGSVLQQFVQELLRPTAHELAQRPPEGLICEGFARDLLR